MTMMYFTAADLKHLDATYNYTARAGLGFAIAANNETVFVTAQDVERLNLNVGDSLSVWATDNHASPHTAHYASRWRAVRVELAARVDDFIRSTQNVTQSPVESPGLCEPHAAGFVGMLDLLLEKQPWTVQDLAQAIAKASAPLSALPELTQCVSARLHTLHKSGAVACLKVFTRSDQQNASAVYYARNVGVFCEHLDTPLDDEE